MIVLDDRFWWAAQQAAARQLIDSLTAELAREKKGLLGLGRENQQLRDDLDQAYQDIESLEHDIDDLAHDLAEALDRPTPVLQRGRQGSGTPGMG